MQLLDAADGGDVRRILTDMGARTDGYMDGSSMKWGVTIEPAAGSAAPTGEILFLAVA